MAHKNISLLLAIIKLLEIRVFYIVKLNHLFGLSALFCILGLQACTGKSSSVSCTLGTDENVTVSGKATFDRVPLLSSGGLDFNNVSQQPVKGAVVEAVCNSAIASAVTDENGNYSLSIPGNTNAVFIRVKAQMLKIGTPSWDVAVSDEAQAAELIFSMDGNIFNSGTSNLTRNLNASSGWDGSSYSFVRVAAPFAILDTIYDAMQLVLAENPNTQFPALDVKWSADSTNGTFYSSAAKTISVLGRISDTDEFDEHVIAHEWGHYFQDAFSRDDSIGGAHGTGDILDIRVAFSEGFGNAFSAMVTGDPVYKDSQSVALANGFTVNIESNSCTNEGWFSECSVQSALYDFFDANNDDVFNHGFQPIYDVLTNPLYLTGSDAHTSIFSFINPFKALGIVNAGNVDTLLGVQSIQSIVDDIGTGMTNDANNVNQIPVYQTPNSTFPDTVLCAIGENGGYNGLGVFRFIQFTVPTDGNYAFEATRQSGLTSTDPDMYIRKQGQLIAYGESTVNNSENFSASLVAGTEYVLELQEYGTYGDPDYDGSLANTTCFDITRTP